MSVHCAPPYMPPISTGLGKHEGPGKDDLGVKNRACKLTTVTIGSTEDLIEDYAGAREVCAKAVQVREEHAVTLLP